MLHAQLQVSKTSQPVSLSTVSVFKMKQECANPTVLEEQMAEVLASGLVAH